MQEAIDFLTAQELVLKLLAQDMEFLLFQNDLQDLRHLFC